MKGKAKRGKFPTSKKFPPRTTLGAPLSIETRTGEKEVVVLDYEKPESKWTEAEKRNAIKSEGVENVPDKFGWTDTPRLSKGGLSVFTNLNCPIGTVTCNSPLVQSSTEKHSKAQ